MSGGTAFQLFALALSIFTLCVVLHSKGVL